MHPLERKILSVCRENFLFSPGDHLVVGVSGGADSMALLHLLVKLAPSLGVTMVVAHVDHGLRPEVAKEEEDLVCSVATGLGLECEVGHLAVAPHAKACGLSLEEAARDLRYAYFSSVATSRGAGKIAVAHTADDQAEEVLLRLLRGAGKKGLSGMTLLREGVVVRPLLTTEKEQLLHYLSEKGIPFAQDQSNSDLRFLRNRIRWELIPYLARFNPNIKQTLRQTAAILKDEEDVLAAQVDVVYGKMVSEKLEGGSPAATVSRTEFRQQPVAIQRRLVEKMLIHLGGKPGFRQIASLIALSRAYSDGQLHLKNGLRVAAEQDCIHLWYPCGQKAQRGNLDRKPAPFSLAIPKPGHYRLLELGQEITVERICEGINPDTLKSPEGLLLDAGKVVFPLHIRNRLPGDRFRPVNGKGSKKVSDFLTDLKMRPEQRDSLPILLSAGRIVALLGVRADHEVRARGDTTDLLKVTLTPI